MQRINNSDMIKSRKGRSRPYLAACSHNCFYVIPDTISIFKFYRGEFDLRYYIADCHFFHDSLNRQMDCRGFANAEEMNNYMIAQWNKKVRWNDEVIILGDFSLGKAEETNQVLEQLNGILCLIEGNHDQFGHKKGYNAARFKWIRPYTELNDNKRKVVLCHYPILCYNGQYLRTEDGEPRTYMLYGHVHDTWDQRLMEQAQALARQQVRRRPDGTEYNLPCRMINCFCMYSDYTPLTLDEWIMNEKARGLCTL